MHLPLKRKIAVVFAAVVMMLAAVPAYAFLKLEDVPKLDRKVAMSKEEFYAATDLKEDTPAGDVSLAYRVRIPKGWISLKAAEESSNLSAEIFKEVATYLSPPKGDTRSRFQIRTLQLNHMISAENWFLNYIVAIGSNIEGLSVKSERRFEAQYTVLEQGQPFTVRATGEISGSKMILAEYYSPVLHYEGEYEDEEAQQARLVERDLQIWSATSFALKTPDTLPIEKMDVYTFIDIVKFSYPAAWILYSPPITSIDRMEASVINLKGMKKEEINESNIYNMQMDGRIDVRVVLKTPETSEQDEIVRLRTFLKGKGLEIGDLIKPITGLEFHKGVIKSKVDAYKIKSEDKRLARYEMWVGMLETNRRYYIITLITTGREENFYTWAQNTQIFQYLMTSLSPVNDVP